MKERERGDWGAAGTRGASTLAWPCATTGGRGGYTRREYPPVALRGYSRRVRWLAAWVAVAMGLISAWWVRGDYWRGRGETAAHPEGPRPLRVYLRGVFPGKQGRVIASCRVPLRVTVGGARALSYGYRRRR